MDREERERARPAHLTDAAPLLTALARHRDFGRFVSRSLPGVIDPVHFDTARAMPILLDRLPRVSNETVKESVVRHLHVKPQMAASREP